MIFDGSSGRTGDLWIYSSTVGLCIVIIGNLKIWMESRFITNWNFIAFFGFSFCLYYSYLWGSNFFHWSPINHTVVALHSSPLMYAVVFAATGFCHFIDRMMVRARSLICPTPADYLQRMGANG
jgi:hypothetical protein